jgi:hypothetical protein
VTIACQNEFASVVVVALDDKPIAKSGRVLVQVGTSCRPTGWKERPMKVPTKEGSVNGARIVEVGKGPWQVVKTHGEIAILNTALTKATVLDPNGMAMVALPVAKTSHGVKITLPEDALYICLELAR